MEVPANLFSLCITSLFWCLRATTCTAEYKQTLNRLLNLYHVYMYIYICKGISPSTRAAAVTEGRVPVEVAQRLRDLLLQLVGLWFSVYVPLLLLLRALAAVAAATPCCCCCCCCGPLLLLLLRAPCCCWSCESAAVSVCCCCCCSARAAAASTLVAGCGFGFSLLLQFGGCCSSF